MATKVKPKVAAKPKLSAAAQRKINYTKNPVSGKYYGKESGKGLLPAGYKGPEVGKYYGPDKYKGLNPKYKAPAAAAAPAAAPASTPVAPDAAPPGQQSAYPPGGGVANSSGTISLQTTHDLNMQELDAQDTYDQEVINANQDEKNSEVLYNPESGTQVNAFNEQRRADRGKLNTSLAYRGMTSGSTAASKLNEMGKAQSVTDTEIKRQRTAGLEGAAARRLNAGNTLAARKKAITLARQSYTTEESDTSPTEGSQAEDSGIAPTTIPVAAPAAAAPVAPAAPKPAAKAVAKFKGKYLGPDRFKGDAKKLAAWRKAGRPKK